MRVSDAGLKAVLKNSRNMLTLIFQYSSGSPESLNAWDIFWDFFVVEARGGDAVKGMRGFV